jgi:uncharacterized protein YdeI (YjbR/CyaY-like superfamily)
MGTRDPRVDAYIDKSADFAKPVLRHLREMVHDTVPEVSEEMKWSMPSFMYRGMLCGIAAFKEHCAFNFWKHSLIVGGDRPDDAMGSFGRITSMADLPPDSELRRYLLKAKQLNDEGVKAPRREKSPEEKKEFEIHPEFADALAGNESAARHFDAFSPSKRKEYLEWISEAKTEPTRRKRIDTAVEWIAEGKSRNWKYERR